MKKIILLFAAIVLMPCISIAEEFVTDGQYIIKVKKQFGSFGKDNSFYAHASLWGSAESGSTCLFTYLGPRFHVLDNASLYLLGGTRHSAAGASATGSVWFNLPFNKEGDSFRDFLFLETDYYAPLDEKKDAINHQKLYIFGEYGHSLKSWSPGFIVEAMEDTETGDWFEAAFGPSISAGKLQFWLAYDPMPSLNEQGIFVRVYFSVL